MNITIEISKTLKAYAEVIDEALKTQTGQHIGFCLVVFTPDRAQYVSNCDRSEVTAALRELLARWEQGMPDIEAHDVS